MNLLKPEKWFTPEPDMVPKTNEVHVWFLDLTKFSLDKDSYNQIFSKQDILRFNSILNDHKREKTVLRYFLLLKILSYYTKMKTNEINLYYSEYGKPFLTTEYEQGEIQFNVSNSFNYLLVGICSNSQIGVDIEKIRKKVNYENLIKRFFSEREKEFFINLDSNDKEHFFFQWWTIKESVIKTIGKGMRLPINLFEIPFENQNNEIDIKIDKSSLKLYFYNLNLEADCTATICIGKSAKQVKFYRLQPEEI